MFGFYHLFFAVVFMLFSTRPAHAYIDPGTGSVILQAILGGVAGIFLFGRLYWTKIKHSFRKRSTEQSSDQKEQDTPEDSSK